MLLAVDVGNSHTVYGLFEGEVLKADWRTVTRPDMTEDEIGVLLRSLFADKQVPLDAVTGMVVSSVVPGVTRVVESVARRTFGVEPLFVGPGIKTGMPILYENPHEVGADRIVNALAAKTRHGAPVVPAASWREANGKHVLRFEDELPHIERADFGEEVRQ